MADVADYPEDVFERVLAVNVRGPFHVAKHALNAMLPGGSLILNSSVVGLTSDAGICAYATSKHALVGLDAHGGQGGRRAAGSASTASIPGPVDNVFQHRIETVATGEPEARAAAIFETMIPLGATRRRTEVAQLVLFLASDESAFMTGATIPLDGGMSV